MESFKKIGLPGDPFELQDFYFNLASFGQLRSCYSRKKSSAHGETPYSSPIFREKAVLIDYKEILRADQNVSFCLFRKAVLTLNGKVTFVEEPAFKIHVMEESAMVKGHYQTPDNLVFKLFLFGK